MCFPVDKGFMDGHHGLSVETVLVGHVDGSVCCIEILDSSTLNIQELGKASRSNGNEASLEKTNPAFYHAGHLFTISDVFFQTNSILIDL